MNLQKIVKDPNTKLVDVRERFEFMLGHAKGAVNIPLSTIPNHVDEIKSWKGPVIAYCRSGNRSGQAVAYLQAQGLNHVYNGGSLSETKAMMR